ncbi:MAG: hypothetical protein LBL91_06185 [Lachnospiraceae bacterium]|jgi:hypothetical protein|nr:hypothetical protein [Lachnospiraceae bacterium]
MIKLIIAILIWTMGVSYMFSENYKEWAEKIIITSVLICLCIVIFVVLAKGIGG